MRSAITMLGKRSDRDDRESSRRCGGSRLSVGDESSQQIFGRPRRSDGPPLFTFAYRTRALPRVWRYRSKTVPPPEVILFGNERCDWLVSLYNEEAEEKNLPFRGSGA